MRRRLITCTRNRLTQRWSVRKHRDMINPHNNSEKYTLWDWQWIIWTCRDHPTGRLYLSETLKISLLVQAWSLNRNILVQSRTVEPATGLKPIPVFTRTRAQFRLVLVKTGIRPSLTPALRLGLVGTRPTGALALMGTATWNCSWYLLSIPKPPSHKGNLYQYPPLTPPKRGIMGLLPREE